MLDLVQKGGPLMWLIILCSITAAGNFPGEASLSSQSVQSRSETCFVGWLTFCATRNYAEALQECAGTPGPVARVAHAVILHHERATFRAA